MEDLISREAAEAEVNKWLDFIDVSEERREDKDIAPVITDVIRCVMKGHWIIETDGRVTQKLIEPLAGGNTAEIVYDHRYTVGDWKTKLRTVDPKNALEVTMAKLSMLSGLPVKLFEKLGRKDWANATYVAVFF